MMTSTRDEIAVSLAVREFCRAKVEYGSFASAHEGFAVLLEEVDELKAEVWKREDKRDKAAMLQEAIQIAAVALRFAVYVCWDEIIKTATEEERD